MLGKWIQVAPLERLFSNDPVPVDRVAEDLLDKLRLSPDNNDLCHKSKIEEHNDNCLNSFE